MVRAYPRLLEHHLRLCGEAKHELDQQTFAQWAADLERSARKQGAAVAARSGPAWARWQRAHMWGGVAVPRRSTGPCRHPLEWAPRAPHAGLAMVAMYAAAPALERIEKEREEAIVAAACAGGEEDGA